MAFFKDSHSPLSKLIIPLKVSADEHGKVQVCTPLLDVAGTEVDYDLLGRIGISHLFGAGFHPVLRLLDGTVPQSDDGGCLKACDDRHLHCKRVPADARNSQAPDHCGHNNPPSYPPKEEQKRSCFSNQERNVENLHECAIDFKRMRQSCRLLSLAG